MKQNLIASTEAENSATSLNTGLPSPGPIHMEGPTFSLKKEN